MKKEHENLDSTSAKGQLLTLIGKMSYEAEKVKAQLQELDENPNLADELTRVCSSCIACGGCIANV